MKKLTALHYSLYNYDRSNQDTCLMHKPTVFEADWVQAGDLLADCSASTGGELSLGHNILVAYMPWEGYNFEDAILLNERLVYDDVFTSIHIERYEIETRKTKLGFEKITRDIPDVSADQLNHLDKLGLAKIGSWVQEGDILVGKVTPLTEKNQSPSEKFLYKLLDKKFKAMRDSSLRSPKSLKAKVIHLEIFSLTPELEYVDSFKKASESRSSSLSIKKTQTNDCGRQTKKIIEEKLKIYAKQKSVRKPFVFTLTKQKVSLIEKKLSFVGVGRRPIGRLETGFNLMDKFLQKKQQGLVQSNSEENPASHPNKSAAVLSMGRLGTHHAQKNTQQNGAVKIQIYLAESRKIQVGDKMAGRHGNKGIVSKILPRQDMPFLPDGTAMDIVLNPLGVPSRMNVGQIYECLLGFAGKYLGENFKINAFDEIYGPEASRSFVFNKLAEAKKKTGLNWLFNPNSPGKIRLFDGRSGDCFDQPITVGNAYMLKLVHMVDDKIHARSTGPYSLVTQQPLRGRSKQGGQRLGEMEVWAIEGYGAAFTLLEMLTIKSDDMTGRMTLWHNLIFNKQITIGTPESFKVLICELQALCLDIGLFK